MWGDGVVMVRDWDYDGDGDGEGSRNCHKSRLPKTIAMAYRCIGAIERDALNWSLKVQVCAKVCEGKNNKTAPPSSASSACER